MSEPSSATVQVPVSVLWRTPEAPRSVDAPIVADDPDHAAWLAAMDAPGASRAESRHGLLDRIETQVVRDEPVLVLEQDEQWSRIVAPWQPSSHDERGYPGYVRTAHLRPGRAPKAPRASAPVEAEALLTAGRRYLGLPYLWGGTSETALDCSGIVHRVCREHRLLVPRDADDQMVASEPLELGSERPGDLYFFAYPGRSVHHVGFVTGRGTMLHAPGTGNGVVDEPMSADRVATLVAVGRIPGVRTGD